MRVGASTLAVGLLLSVALPTGAVRAADPGEQLLLERANFWRTQHRPDLAGAILGKILASNPDQPDALYQRGMLAMEQGDRGGAQQYFDRLRGLAAADKHAGELLAALTPAPPAAAPPAPKPATAAAAALPAPKPAAAAAAAPVSKPAAAAAAAPASKPAAAAAIAAPAPNLAAAAAVASAPNPAAAARAVPPAPAKAAAVAANTSQGVAAASSAPPVRTPVEPAIALAAGSADSDDLIADPAAVPRTVTATSARPLPALVAAKAPAADTPTYTQLAALPPMTISDGDTVIPTTASDDLGKTARATQVAQVELQPPPPVNGYQPLGTLRPYSPSDTLEVYIERDLENLEMQANPTLIAGLGYRTHSGAEGIGRLDEFGSNAQVSFSPWYTGTATIAVMPVYLESGTPANGNLTNFGANRVLAAVGIGNANAVDQNAFGVGLLGTYSYGDFTGQIGTTPLGFPITNIIGDIAYAPKFLGGNMSVRVEGFRQPVTDTVLSYAGTRASLTTANAVTGGAFGGYNTLWGGVVKTGPRVTVFYDDQMYGAYGGVGYSWLTGTNVADNAALDALLGAYFRPWKTDYWTLRVGLSAFYAGYDKNVSGYTYGQGGYFSPQDFEGIGIPVEISGSYDRWSYLASTTLGTQHFNAHASPIFPINASAQQFMQVFDPANAFNSGLHGGWGFGFNIKGQVEYAVDKTLALGLAGGVNNSNNYDEGIVQVYLRKTFDWFSPIASNDPQAIAARDHL
ncbi:MAG TPA: cellulose synthase subunit BcsC-related outer membrane protein [Stellaceae bacterium]|nr:cellulose synthase subunit BcsC-related outer membrane protein [Stellaceae bacterium]